MTRREDGTYNIEFDDKEIFKEFKVPVTRIRKVSQTREPENDGRKEERKEGREKGRKEGRKEERKEGRKEGRDR